MKPHVIVKVGSNPALEDYAGAICRLTKKQGRSYTKTVHENDLDSFVMDTPGDSLHVTPYHRTLTVTVKNNTGVPLVLETRIGGETLDDVLKANREYTVPHNSQVKVTV